MYTNQISAALFATPFPRQFPMPETIDHVVVHHADRLHVGIADRTAHELEAMPF
jgi:hypothetical protein